MFQYLAQTKLYPRLITFLSDSVLALGLLSSSRESMQRKSLTRRLLTLRMSGTYLIILTDSVAVYWMNVNCRYFSYGAAMEPSLLSFFRLSHRILKETEGYNDGLVSVASSRWGGEQGYKGTLAGVSHLDLINWSNRLKWLAGEITGNKRKYVLSL